MLHIRNATKLIVRAKPKLDFLHSRNLSNNLTANVSNESETKAIHFRASTRAHPLYPNGMLTTQERLGDHTGKQQNHIWSESEIEERMATLYRHKPATWGDQFVNSMMYGFYHSFNFLTGYNKHDPSVRSMEWRLIVLESLAGVPGFVAAGFRHFRSLRSLNRDYGWIPTLLEEAENERMHLLVCLNMFKANAFTRTLVVATQLFMTPLLMGMYLVNPKLLHRFVGYLEETACHTYVNVIEHIEKPGTQLHAGWAHLPAPEMAKGYWRLPENAKWVDTLKCIMADETHHRDVNHTFADMKSDDPNPFLQEHKENAAHAWRLEMSGKPAEWKSITSNLNFKSDMTGEKLSETIQASGSA